MIWKKEVNPNPGQLSKEEEQFAQLFNLLSEYYITPKDTAFRKPLITRIMEIFTDE